jgi:AraC-like DNA-binding protein
MNVRSKSVSSALARMGMHSSLKRGIGPQEFERLTGISELEAAQPDGRISADKHIAMLNLTEPAWSPRNPLECVTDISVNAPVGTLLALVTNAPSLAAAFDTFLAYRGLLGDVDTLSFQREGREFEFVYQLDGKNRTTVSAFGNLGLMATLARQYTRASSTIAALEFSGEAFAPIQQLQEAAGCRISFGQARNRMLLKAENADQPYAKHNDVTYSIISGQAEAALGKLYQRTSFTLQVEAHIADLFREQREWGQRGMSGMGGTPLDQLCERLLISRSAIHRRLQKEGANFQSVLSRVRMHEARRLLRQSGMQIADISDLLGFSSPGAFSRFFSDQLGTSPSRYRLANHTA